MKIGVCFDKKCRWRVLETSMSKEKFDKAISNHEKKTGHLTYVNYYGWTITGPLTVEEYLDFVKSKLTWDEFMRKRDASLHS